MDYDNLTTLWRNLNNKWKGGLEEFCSQLNISYVDRLVLAELAKHKSLTKNELAAHMDTIHQNLTRSINRLVAGKLLKMTKSLEDGRYRKLELTTKGRAMNEKISKKINESWKVMLGRLTAEEKINLIKIMTKLSESK